MKNTLFLLALHLLAKEMALSKQDNLNGSGWMLSTGKDIDDFSAVAYYFGKYLHLETGIPIGLISTSRGGTNVEKPQFVRYAWQNYPADANLMNSENRPASPFRTGTWAGAGASCGPSDSASTRSDHCTQWTHS